MSVLLVVVGILCLIIGAIILLSCYGLYEHERARFLRLGLYFAGAGAVSFLTHFCFISLPDIISERSSETARRRKEFFRLHQRPKNATRQDSPNPEAGSVLIVALILLGLVSAVALRVTLESRRAQKEAAAAFSMGMLKLTAVDTARMAMQKLADDPDLRVDHPGDDWAEFSEFKDPAGITRMTRIVDAQRMFDLNNTVVDVTGNIESPSSILAGIMMLSRHYTPGQRIDALADWVDGDDAGSYESAFYQRQNPPSYPANRILFGVDELMSVAGWDMSMLESRTDRPRNFLIDADLVETTTILPVARNRVIPLNINTAHPVALLGVLGIGREAVVERIMARRKDQPIYSIAMLADMLPASELNRLSPYLDVKSRFYHIQATAYQDGRSARLYLLAEREDNGEVRAVQAFF